MQIIYLVVLMVSAIAVAAGFVRSYQQLAPVFQANRQALGATVAIPMLAFLIIVSTPAPVVLAALLLMLIGMWDAWRGISRDMGLALTLLAASIGSMGLPVAASSVLPAPLVALLLWIGWWVLILGAEYVPQAASRCFLLLTIAWIPLVAASWIGVAPGHIALDVAMVTSSMLGALMAAPSAAQALIALRLPLLLLLGYSIARTLLADAWPFALASLVLLIIGGFWPKMKAKQKPVVAN